MRSPGAAQAASASELEATLDGWDTSMPVIIASNRLPVRVSRRSESQGETTDSVVSEASPTSKWIVEWAGDLVIEAQNTFSHHEISDHADVKFVGRITDCEIPVEEQRDVALKLQEFNCYPVFVGAHEAKLYYEDYCKQTLWPTFHNVIDVYSPVDVVLEMDEEEEEKKHAQYWNPGHQKLAWQAYASVNQMFANVRADCRRTR